MYFNFVYIYVYVWFVYKSEVEHKIFHRLLYDNYYNLRIVLNREILFDVQMSKKPNLFVPFRIKQHTMVLVYFHKSILSSKINKL